jgi:Putative zincin peptidase
MTLRLIDRFQPRLRDEQQKAINADQLRLCDEFEALNPQQLQPLAVFSMQLLCIGLLFFGIINYLAYSWQKHTFALHLTFWGVVLWLLLNVVGYISILPIHEVIHALAFLFWGGRPYFGTKLPLALYCGARQQLFRRNAYLVVGLAPLIVITLVGIIVTLAVPGIAAYAILAIAGNLSGAAGDLWAVTKLLLQPEQVLVEDTDAGYRAWEISAY